jgi:hypothetical protein
MWKTKQGLLIPVSEMSLDHVKNTLNMLIKNHNKPTESVLENRGSDFTIVCISHGSRYASSINVDKMSEEELRELLVKVCNDPRWFKKIIAEQCFGPVQWPEIVRLIEQ